MLFNKEEQRAIEYAVNINSDMFYSRFSRTSTRLLHPLHKESYMKYLDTFYPAGSIGTGWHLCILFFFRHRLPQNFVSFTLRGHSHIT